MDLDNSIWKTLLCFYQSELNNVIRRRDWLQQQMLSFQEYVYVNGRLYRYGFVSQDLRRVHDLLRQMFQHSIDRFQKRTTLTLDDFRSFCPDHVSTVPLVIWKTHLPVSLPEGRLNQQSLRWLQQEYKLVDQLNAVWRTNFVSWDDVRVDSSSEYIHDAVVQLTNHDTNRLQVLLKRVTKYILNAETQIDQARNQFRNSAKVSNDTDRFLPPLERRFVQVARIPGIEVDTIYVWMLLFAASRFQPLTTTPNDLHVVRTQSDFLINFFTNRDFTQYLTCVDLGDDVHTIQALVHRIPPLTLATPSAFRNAAQR